MQLEIFPLSNRWQCWVRGVCVWLVVWLVVWLCKLCDRHLAAHFCVARAGGVIWATGNICVVPIVKAIGLSKGLLLWGSTNMLTGWASGRFGHVLIGPYGEVLALLALLCLVPVAETKPALTAMIGCVFVS